MSNSSHESLTNQPRTLLGGALSYEFSDCSIAAADLSKRAGDSLQEIVEKDSSYNEGVYFVIGDGEDAQQFVYKIFSDREGFQFDGRYTDLVLAQPLETVKVDQEVVEKKWLMSRHVQRPFRKKVLKDDPFMAVVVGTDTLLPLASFARRKDGQCSYVQLGQEMYDDNFFVTPTDDDSSRHGLIEALRTRVTGGANDETRIATISIIQEFINQQVEAQHEALAKAYESQLVRTSFKQLSEGAEQSHLTVIGEQQTTPELYDTATVIPPCILDDGRSVSLVLARPHDNDPWLGDRLQVFAVTRKGIAAPLGAMSRQFANLELVDDVALSPPDREQIVRDLLFAIIARPDLHSLPVDDKEESYNTDELGETDHEIAQYCCERGALTEYERYRSRGGKVVPVRNAVRRRLDAFFAYPDSQYSPYPDSAPLKRAAKRLELQQISDRKLLTDLQAGKRLTEVLGEARKCDEVLMHYIAKLALASGEMRAIFSDVQIGKTRAEARVAAEVTLVDDVYELTISGRPASMPDEPMKPLLGVNLRPIRPYLGQEKAKDSSFDEVHVDELIDIVSGIYAAQQD